VADVTPSEIAHGTWAGIQGAPDRSDGRSAVGKGPDGFADGRMTLVAVYEHVEHAYAARRDLVGRDLDPAPLLLSRRDDGPEQGTNPVIVGEGYGVSAMMDDNVDDPPAGRERIDSAVAVGATIGGTVGLLATTYIVPGVGTVLAGVGPLASTLAGAGLGAFLGGLVQGSINESDATIYPGQVRLGGVLVATRVRREQAEAARAVLQRYLPLEVRIV